MITRRPPIVTPPYGLWTPPKAYRKPRRVHPRVAQSLGVDLVSGARPTPRDSGDYGGGGDVVHAMDTYVEFPVDLIRDIHFKQGPGHPGGGDTTYAPPYCGTMTYGEATPHDVRTIGDVETVPTLPMVGTFSGHDPYNQVAGNIITPLADERKSYTSHGGGAVGIMLYANDLHLSTTILSEIEDADENIGDVLWGVPMARGYEWKAVPIYNFLGEDTGSVEFHPFAMFVSSYSIALSFAWADPPSTPIIYGFAISLIPNAPGVSIDFTDPDTWPPGPLLTASSPIGDFSWDYDFQYLENWHNPDSDPPVIDTSNMWDLSLGGPAMLWQGQINEAAPRADHWLWGTCFGCSFETPGCSYNWTITANCDSLPLPPPPVPPPPGTNGGGGTVMSRGVVKWT